MHSPEIISFNNGVIEWRHNGVQSFILRLNKKERACGNNTFDTSGLSENTRICIAAADGNGNRTSDFTMLFFNAAERSLEYLPLEVRVCGEVLRWTRIEGVSEYRVVDISFNAATVTGDEYDMSGKNLVYGVYPVSSTDGVKSAGAEPETIQYLAGRGTEREPYIIRTPFDLRAVDYYELLSGGKTRNRYRIDNDIDYNTVGKLEVDSNIYTLSKPFFGVLDGNGKKLSGIRVHYDGGYWALFDFIARGGEVRNMVFDYPAIANELQDKYHPLNAAVATVAYRNYGVIEGVKVHRAVYSAAGGAVCGIAAINCGTVRDCAVSGVFKQFCTGLRAQACYEMSGAVLENRSGGVVERTHVSSLAIVGAQCAGEGDVAYNNVRVASGIVAFNRKGGIVRDCSFKSVNMTHILSCGSECGGIAAYNAGTVRVRAENVGTLKWSDAAHVGAAVAADIGDVPDLRGRVIGKNDGECQADNTERDGNG